MAYVNRDFKTKKEFLAAIKAGESVYLEQNMFGQLPIYAGDQAAIEGPKYRPHTWYATVTVDPTNGKVRNAK